MPIQQGGPVKKTNPAKSATRALLEASEVTPNALQREAMGTDVDLDRFMIYLSQKAKFDLAERITEAEISRSISASSILTVHLNDYDRAVLNSGLLYNKLDVELDGLWFRLKGVDKSGDDLTLTFEDREIAVLRSYDTWKIASRDKVTRAMFIWNLIHEVKEFEIPFVIPELRIFQPIQDYAGDLIGVNPLYDKTIGISIKDKRNKPYKTVPGYQFAGNPPPFYQDKRAKYTVKGSPATKEQINNANIVIQVGKGMEKEGVTRRIIVSAIATCIVESGLINNPGGMDDSAGLFQQRPSMGWGSYAEVTDPATAATSYYRHAIHEDKRHPEFTTGQLAQAVQRSGKPLEYAKRLDEAKVFVTHAGIPGDDTESSAGEANNSYENTEHGGGYYFYRGRIEDKRKDRVRKPEDSWACIQRLADEVDWRAFFVSGTFFYMSEDALMKQQPLLTLNEFAEGIKRVDGDFHQKKQAANMTVTADVGRWTIPPGAVVEVEEMGVFNGRWYVEEYQRSLFSLEATINLARERPMLPEPLQGNEEELRNWIPGAASGKSAMKGAYKSTDYYEEGTGEGVEVTQSEKDLASKLIWHNGKGNWDHNHGTGQILKVKMGQNLTNKCGDSVKMDARPMAVVLYLIEKGFTVTTTAWCEDHDCLTDGGNVSAHSMGKAVDIGGINGKTSGNMQEVRNAMSLLNKLKGDLAPSQLICGGWGGTRDETLRGLCIPSAEYFGESTMSGHCDHIHVGYSGALDTSIASGTGPTSGIKMVFPSNIGFSYIAAHEKSYDVGRSPFTLAEVKWICIHTTAGATGENAAEGIGNYFAGGAGGRYVSAHYAVDSNSIVRCVLDTNSAYATGSVINGKSGNAQSISIEHCGAGEPSAADWASDYYQSMLKISAQLVGKLCNGYGIPATHVGPAGLSAGTRGIAGHDDFSNVPGSGGDHTDPGPNFPWTSYLQMVQAEMNNL